MYWAGYGPDRHSSMI